VTEQAYRITYLRVGETPAGVEDRNLYCDPLTSLVAYPSFEQHLIDVLPVLVSQEVHIAIGDVDGLRDYVTERRAADPFSFGHLAGNACMQVVGAVTSAWAGDDLADAAFQICGTFGGDEVIVVATGFSHFAFAEKVHRLCGSIKTSSPRPCSFALATLQRCSVAPEQARDVYRSLVSMVDAELFYMKEHARTTGGHLDGSVSDLGVATMVDDALNRKGVAYPATIGGGR
jgi:GGDEF domain-containing protein